MPTMRGKLTCLKQELQQSKCRDFLCSKQEPLKGTHPTECCIIKRKDGECHVNEKLHTPDPKYKLYTYDTISNDESWLHRSTDSNIICSRCMGSEKPFCLLVEYGKYCCLVLLSCMSLRSIVRRVSLKQLSLRSIHSSFTMNLDRVKARIGQTYGRVESDRSKYLYLYAREIQREVQ